MYNIFINKRDIFYNAKLYDYAVLNKLFHDKMYKFKFIFLNKFQKGCISS